MTMKRARFVQDAKLDPDRYYRNPHDVIRDRRLNNKERLDIVRAWELATERRIASLHGEVTVDERLDQLRRLRKELEEDAEARRSEPADLGQRLRWNHWKRRNRP
jgi:hypothetical protein